jgi:hypothetical protein
MTDPFTVITASTIANLAFQEFIKSGSGELAKKFTTEAIAKMDELRKTILNKLRGTSPGETHLNFIDKIPFLCINERIGIYRLMDFFRVIVMV